MFTTPVYISNTTSSQSASTGALQISGGMGIYGNVNVGNSLSVSGVVNVGDIVLSNVPLGTGSTNTVVTGTTLYMGGNCFVVSNHDVTVSSGSQTTASLMTNGGIYVEKDAYVNKNLTVNGTILTTQGSTIVSITNDTDVTVNIVTAPDGTEIIALQNYGALQVNGGASFLGNIYVGKTMHCNNFDATTIKVTGILESYTVTTGALICPGGFGVGKSIHMGGNLTVLSQEAALSTSTGSLLVSGGVGIGGNTFVGGNVTIKQQVSIASTIDSTSVGTGSLVVNGGSSMIGNCNIGGSVIITGGSANSDPIEFEEVTAYPLFNTDDARLIDDGTGGSNKYLFSNTETSKILGYLNGKYYMSAGSTYSGSSVINAFDISSSCWISNYAYSTANGYPDANTHTLGYTDISSTFIM